MAIKQRWLFLIAFVAFVGAAIIVAIVLTNMKHDTEEPEEPESPEISFAVGESDFLLDGKKFQYVAGSFHYFRALRDSWRDRLVMMKAAGLTVVDTYVEWSTHNPEPGVYVWDGLADLEYFLELTSELGFYVILRPGPYICAERDNGGLPYWLFTKYPTIKVRTSDANFLAEVEIWYEKLFERVQKHMHGLGGNIIMVQVENEYGAFPACDLVYRNWLRDETQKYVNDTALLFTVDMPNETALSCGSIEDVFVTTDFGIDRVDQIDDIITLVRKYQPTGPIVNSEYYPGWLTYWQNPNERRDAEEIARVLRVMLEKNINVNFYVFFGGTNFGFNTGSSDLETGTYVAGITSYDYDAPMDEAGDYTAKFNLIRYEIQRHFPDLVIPDVPAKKPKMGNIQLSFKALDNLLSPRAIAYLSTKNLESETPLSFEEFGQFSGYLLYEAQLPEFEIDPALLTVEGVADRALVYVDDLFVGILSRQNQIYSLPINSGTGSKLKILVENQGRSNYYKLDDIKGILGSVTIQRFEANTVIEVTNWKMTGFPLTNTADINRFTEGIALQPEISYQPSAMLKEGPLFFYAQLTVVDPTDTYLDTTGWGKGNLFVNGFNLGRYWPVAGPQMTMFIPKEILKAGTNEFLMLELQHGLPTARLLDHAILDGKE